MEVFKLKDIQLIQKKHTYVFIYFYDDWCHKITKLTEEQHGS